MTPVKLGNGKPASEMPSSSATSVVISRGFPKVKVEHAAATSRVAGLLQKTQHHLQSPPNMPEATQQARPANNGGGNQTNVRLELTRLREED